MAEVCCNGVIQIRDDGLLSSSHNVVEVLIKCLSWEFLRQIESADNDGYILPKSYGIFTSPWKNKEPSVQSIMSLCYHIFECSQLEPECLVGALIYMKQLGRNTDNKCRICAQNWKSVLLVCLMMASKMLDDYTVTNAEFARVCNCDIRFLNSLELRFLDIFDYSVNISAPQFQSHVSYVCKWHALQEINTAKSVRSHKRPPVSPVKSHKRLTVRLPSPSTGHMTTIGMKESDDRTSSPVSCAETPVDSSSPLSDCRNTLPLTKRLLIITQGIQCGVAVNSISRQLSDLLPTIG